MKGFFMRNEAATLAPLGRNTNHDNAQPYDITPCLHHNPDSRHTSFTAPCFNEKFPSRIVPFFCVKISEAQELNI